MDSFLIFVLKNPKFWWRVFEEESTAKNEDNLGRWSFPFYPEHFSFLKNVYAIVSYKFLFEKIFHFTN